MSTAILLAEPEPSVRGFLARQLADDGFAVLAAADPLAAPDAPADLVLLGDPGALERWQPACPVIVLGAPDADLVDCVRAFQRGVRRLRTIGVVRAFLGLGGRFGPVSCAGTCLFATLRQCR